MNVEVINTGTELLLGNVTNTHLTFLGQELFKLGLRINRQVCVPDGPAIRDALLDAFPRADLVLVTGGLGPTSDDLTRDLTAELLGRPMSEDPAILARLRAYFRKVNRPFLDTLARQAQVPAGATVIENHHGTAPGLYLPPGPPSTDAPGKHSTPHVFLLPGPPRELRPMFTGQVAPMIAALRPKDYPHPQSRNYRLIGLGETQVQMAVGTALEKIEGLEVGYCARLGEVDLRCIGTPEMLARADEIVQPALGSQLLPGNGDVSLEATVMRLLCDGHHTLAVVESCTGGLLAHRLTNVPGVSTVFMAGFITYSNKAKMDLVNVDGGLIEHYGAVSEPVAAAMAAGARAATGATFALSTTGEAGPEPSGQGQPVGTLFIALADDSGAPPTVERHFMPTDREAFKQRATQMALDLLRRRLSLPG